MFAFTKSERSNISKAELRALQELAIDLLAFDENSLESAAQSGALMEITYGNH
jgi:hypothetical protein